MTGKSWKLRALGVLFAILGCFVVALAGYGYLSKWFAGPAFVLCCIGEHLVWQSTRGE